IVVGRHHSLPRQENSTMHQRTRLHPALFVVLAAFGCAGSMAETSSTSPGSDHNPFKGANFFINPAYAANVKATAKRHPDEAERILKVAQYPTAVWLDSIEHVDNLAGWLDEAKKQQIAVGKPTVSVVVVYDLPNRDCSAASSGGELKVAQNGEARYMNEFIDPIAAQFKAHSDQPIVVLLEPDSLGNLATNMALPMCQEAKHAYRNGIIYAIKKFALPNVSIYLDAAHSGWLGWDDNRAKIAKIFKSVLADAGGPGMIRGFALNTASNGKGQIRKAWGSWCNVHGAGLGERPRVDPEPGIDVYFWVKPPGESDGVSDAAGPRFDAMCGGPDAAKGAPQAGQWFESYFVDLVRNAKPPL